MNIQNMHWLKTVSSTLVMVMLMTCVVLRRFTDDGGVLWAESSSVSDVAILGNENKQKYFKMFFFNQKSTQN